MVVDLRTYLTQGSVEIAPLKKKKDDEQFGTFANTQFSTFATVSSDFDGHVGLRIREYERQEPIKAVSLYFRGDIQASVCITHHYAI